MRIIVFIAVLVFGALSYASNVDLEASHLKWTGAKVTGKHYGKMPLKSGFVNLNKKSKIKSGTFVVSVADFTIEDLKGGWAKKFIKHMKSPDFFDVKKWPEAKLEITEMKKGLAAGKLTIKGKTKTIRFPYTESKGVYTGTLEFDRTEFGMVYNSGSFFKDLGDKAIRNEVLVEFSIKLKK